jgi:hypothetical protein
MLSLPLGPMLRLYCYMYFSLSRSPMLVRLVLTLFRNEAGTSLRIAGGGTAINKMTLVMPVESLLLQFITATARRRRRRRLLGIAIQNFERLGVARHFAARFAILARNINVRDNPLFEQVENKDGMTLGLSPTSPMKRQIAIGMILLLGQAIFVQHGHDIGPTLKGGPVWRSIAILFGHGRIRALKEQELYRELFPSQYRRHETGLAAGIVARVDINGPSQVVVLKHFLNRFGRDSVTTVR